VCNIGSDLGFETLKQGVSISFYTYNPSNMKNTFLLLLTLAVLMQSCITPVYVKPLRPRPIANQRVWQDGSVSQRNNQVEINYLYQGSTEFFHIFDVLIFNHRGENLEFNPQQFYMTATDQGSKYESLPYYSLSRDSVNKFLQQLEVLQKKAQDNQTAWLIVGAIAATALTVATINTPNSGGNFIPDLWTDIGDAASNTEYRHQFNVKNVQQLSSMVKSHFAQAETISDTLQHGGLVFFPRVPAMLGMRFHYPIDSNTVFNANFEQY
jgi:hypothetical protein